MKVLSPAMPDGSKPFSGDHVIQLHFALAIFLAASFVVFIPAWVMDPRILDSANVWTKPQKFHIALSLHFLTIAVLMQFVPREVRNGWVLILFSYLAAIGVVFEYVWVSVQAGQAERSHFNEDTVFEQIMYGLMGLGAFFLMTIALALAIQIWRKGDRTRRGLWLGAIVGLGLSFATTNYFGFTMSTYGRYVGSPLTGGGETVPFFGWSREYGDLRPAHFVSLHLMQTVPFAGWLADRYGWNAPIVVCAVAAAQLSISALLFFQALGGDPFWPV
ncbi:MAG: hypothetical protein AAGK17_05390 [Pseudomonadota bacterium]